MHFLKGDLSVKLILKLSPVLVCQVMYFSFFEQTHSGSFLQGFLLAAYNIAQLFSFFEGVTSSTQCEAAST